MNNIHVIHMLICFIYLKLFESGILVPGISNVWEDTGGCDMQFRCYLSIYLMTVISSSYGIIIDRGINAPSVVNNFFD